MILSIRITTIEYELGIQYDEDDVPAKRKKKRNENELLSITTLISTIYYYTITMQARRKWNNFSLFWNFFFFWNEIWTLNTHVSVEILCKKANMLGIGTKNINFSEFNQCMGKRERERERYRIKLWKKYEIFIYSSFFFFVLSYFKFIFKASDAE